MKGANRGKGRYWWCEFLTAVENSVEREQKIQLGTWSRHETW